MWQIKCATALGVSAWGTAVTLSIIMGGMSIGAWLMGRYTQSGSSIIPLRLYGLLELIVGVSGLFLNAAFHFLEKLDTWAFTNIPSSISLVYIIGMVVVFGIPALCMGATLPVFGVLAEEYKTSVSKLYSLNTIGAALGVMMIAFMLIPVFGMTHTIALIAALNIGVGLIAGLIIPAISVQPIEPIASHQPILLSEWWIVFITGFATFTLEVAWFRALSALFPNTTDAFAIMLACLLLALGLAAKNSTRLKQKKQSLYTQLCLAGVLILLMTPLIEHLDSFYVMYKHLYAHAVEQGALTHGVVSHPISDVISSYFIHILLGFAVIYFMIGIPMQFLGVAFPWIIDQRRIPQSIGKLYAVNTLASIAGSIGAAWLLLPALGFAKTAWIAGGLVLFAGLAISPRRQLLMWSACGIASLAMAMFFETGIGKTRAQGFLATDDKGNPAKLLDFYNGPDTTVSALEYRDGSRLLLINSSGAAAESGHTFGVQYMSWMGYLPMLLQSNHKNALVICFGTGQTANAVRKENPLHLDIVDINPNVFKLAHHFKSNENVLDDARVKKIVMDGKAYIRRTSRIYDVITLEPMPPNNAGVNALYSKEFYEVARTKLAPNGIIAQWLPFHLLSPHFTASIARTFMGVFPNAILWIEPRSHTGILLGSKNNAIPIERTWQQSGIKKNISLTTQQLQQYSNYGEMITDDNQLLSYGKVLYTSNLIDENFELLHRINPNVTLR